MSSDRRGPKRSHIPAGNKLGAEIQRARKDKDLTTVELGGLVGVSDASVTQTEAGQTIPRKPTVIKYEEVLGVALLPLYERDLAKRKNSGNKTRTTVRIKFPESAELIKKIEALPLLARVEVEKFIDRLEKQFGDNGPLPRRRQALDAAEELGNEEKGNENPRVQHRTPRKPRR